ncbi:hypothetical protein BDA99DRAFT_55953 [Phascolomyces articulosus]|uniref:Uncharacterized protein n=1 Tax=Phascolomyces articulosus TaxID=60185 RepID=A0AAD5PEP0_9FUNG|nr:hypothetical protein BDA99DRAFT_55953 [Phascolomyces articulosus]
MQNQSNQRILYRAANHHDNNSFFFIYIYSQGFKNVLFFPFLCYMTLCIFLFTFVHHLLVSFHIIFLNILYEILRKRI